MKVAVIGAGGWGTALGLVLQKNGHEITIWGHNPENLRNTKAARENTRYLPGVKLPESWRFETELQQALAGTNAAILALPSKAFRETVAQVNDYTGLLVSVTKGIESETGKTMSAIARECAPRAEVAALSGPSLAPEVARGIPTAAVVASESEEIAKRAQQLF